MDFTKRMSTAQVLENAIGKAEKTHNALCERKNSALNTFRFIVHEIDEVNEALQEEHEELESLIKHAEEIKTGSETSMEENNRIKAKIIEIIGE